MTAQEKLAEQLRMAEYLFHEPPDDYWQGPGPASGPEQKGGAVPASPELSG